MFNDKTFGKTALLLAQVLHYVEKNHGDGSLNFYQEDVDSILEKIGLERLAVTEANKYDVEFFDLVKKHLDKLRTPST